RCTQLRKDQTKTMTEQQIPKPKSDKQPSSFLRECAAVFADVFAERPPFQDLRDALKSPHTAADIESGRMPASFIPGAIQNATTELRAYVVSAAHRATHALSQLKKKSGTRGQAEAAVAAFRVALDAWRKSEEAILWLRELAKQNSNRAPFDNAAGRKRNPRSLVYFR